MLHLDDLFTSAPLDPPKLRDWKARAAKSKVPPTVEVRRERQGLGFAPAELCFTADDDRGEALSDAEPWDAQLALSTLEVGWRAPEPTLETVRLALVLRSLFMPIETRHGGSYFTPALVSFLRDSEFAQEAPVSQVLKFVRVHEIPASPPIEDCKESIRAVLVRVAKLLTEALRYPQPEAKAILANAVGYYLDDRFSIGAGQVLGLYRDPD